MSRLFIAANTEYLGINQAIVSGAPLSKACWFNPNAFTTEMILLSLYDGPGSNDRFLLAFRGDQAGDPVAAMTTSNVTGVALSIAGVGGISQWAHAAAVFAAADDRRAFFNGGNKGTNADSKIPAGIAQTNIGRQNASQGPFYFSGSIAEAAIWNAALTDYEVYLHSTGIPAIFIRPQNLAAYWPLVSAEDFDWYRRYDMTAFNTPGIAPHPPKVLEFWRRYWMRAVTTQGISRLVSWGVPNEWNVRAMVQAAGIVPFRRRIEGY